MYHFVARTRFGLLAPTPAHAQALWERLRPLSMDCEALCLMPNHIHLLTPRPCREALAQVPLGHGSPGLGLVDPQRLPGPGRAPDAVGGAGSRAFSWLRER